MSWEGWFTIATIATCFSLLALTRIAPDIVMSAGLTMLLISGVLLPAEALSGFSNEGMLTVAILYIVVSGLTETGAISWVRDIFLGHPRSLRHAQFKLMTPTAILSAFLNNTPVVAMFIPATQDWARRHRLSISKLLIPLSFASIAGGTCTLIGTSTNLVVNGMLVSEAGENSLGVFELLWIGLPVVAVVMVFVLLFGKWLLPDRMPAINQIDNVREYTVEMRVEPNSLLVGKSIEEAELRNLPNMYLMEIERNGRVIPAVSPNEVLQENDRLVFVGIVDSVLELQKITGLLPVTNQLFKLNTRRSDRNLFEAVVSDSCPLLGKSVREGRFRSRYNAVIIALARNGERLNQKIGDIVLRAGDTLLLEGYPGLADQHRNSRDFFLISEISNFHPPREDRAGVAIGIVVLMVLAAGSGLLSMLKASMLAAGLMLIARCTNGRVARRAPDWGVLVVIAASFGMGVALQKTGAANWLADWVIGMAAGTPEYALALVFIFTSILSVVATNNVAAVLMFPVAMAVSSSMGLSMVPFAITIMISASASFATPIGYQTNLMVYNSGGYRFSDYVKIGAPLTLLVGITTVYLVPYVWTF